jgi:hypothetical protein
VYGECIEICVIWCQELALVEIEIDISLIHKGNLNSTEMANVRQLAVDLVWHSRSRAAV